jgi:hypothetical protein
MTSYKVVAMVLVLVFCLMVFLPTVASAAKLIGQLVKVFGIGYVVTQFGGQINSFINSLSGQHGVKWAGTTKVVPIISVGQGGYIGAAQVQGPSDKVKTVKAVGQVEARISSFRGRLLVPVNTINPTNNLTRVKGVGVSALIDFKI